MGIIKILVCTHKKADMPQASLYLPIQTGAALTEEHWGIQRDDEGCNISLKNRNFSELTAHYWAWKNLMDYDYIGLAHYRRFLDIVDEKSVCKSLEKNDILLPEPQILPHSNMFNLNEVLTREDVYIMMACLKRKYPDYIPTANKYLLMSNKNVCCNMFITSKTIFEDYSKWLFDILFETEKYVRLSGYTRMRRIYGYFSEVLLPIYVQHHHLKYKYVPVIDFPGNKNSLKHSILRNMKNIRNNLCFSLLRPYEHSFNPLPSTVTSMKADKLPLY